LRNDARRPVGLGKVDKRPHHAHHDLGAGAWQRIDRVVGVERLGELTRTDLDRRGGVQLVVAEYTIEHREHERVGRRGVERTDLGKERVHALRAAPFELVAAEGGLLESRANLGARGLEPFFVEKVLDHGVALALEGLKHGAKLRFFAHRLRSPAHCAHIPLWNMDQPNLPEGNVNVAQLNGTQASLLGFLHEGPRTGWQLLQEISSGLGRFWNVTQSHAYRELKVLEERGLIVAGELGPRDRRPFRLTAKGRKAFAQWIQEEPGPEQIRFPLLVSLWFGEHLPPDRLARFVDSQRRIRQERLAHYRKAEEEFRSPREHPRRRAVLQFGMRYEEAILRWLDEVEDTTERERALRTRVRRGAREGGQVRKATPTPTDRPGAPGTGRRRKPGAAPVP
jgi:DNA-binding PadR family transcriptional regulator